MCACKTVLVNWYPKLTAVVEIGNGGEEMDESVLVSSLLATERLKILNASRLSQT